MSKKLSARSPTEARARMAGSSPVSKAGSSLSAITPQRRDRVLGRDEDHPAALRDPGHRDVSRAWLGIVAPSPSAGISTQRPSPPKRHP